MALHRHMVMEVEPLFTFSLKTHSLDQNPCVLVLALSHQVTNQGGGKTVAANF
jgi:hypothetical protein